MGAHKGEIKFNKRKFHHKCIGADEVTDSSQIYTNAAVTSTIQKMDEN